MKTVYQDENNVVLNENSVEIKPCINRESNSDMLTIQLYSCHNINMKFLEVVTPPSIYQLYRLVRKKGDKEWTNQKGGVEFLAGWH